MSAIQQLNQNTDTVQSRESISSSPIQKWNAGSEPPGARWQDRGNVLLDIWEDNLWGDVGRKAIEYLTARGLASKTIKKYKLGYIPTDTYEDPQFWGMGGTKIYLPRGIVIPCFIGNDLWYLNIRLPNNTAKYHKIRGGKSALFGSVNLHGAWLGMLVGGEFDCMLVDQELKDVVGVATFGSASGSIDVLQWWRYFLPVEVMLVLFNANKTGYRVAEQLVNKIGQAQLLPMPTLPGDVKSLTDYYLAGGDLWEWLKSYLSMNEIIQQGTMPIGSQA